MNIQQEGRLKFWRYEFAFGGFIDRIMCDMGDDPNREEAPNYSLNASATWYRLNGKDRWVNAREFNRGFYAIIQGRSDTDGVTAFDCWHMNMEKWSQEVVLYHIQQQWLELKFKFDYTTKDGKDGYVVIVENDKLEMIPTNVFLSEELLTDMNIWHVDDEGRKDMFEMIINEIQKEINRI